MFSNKYYQMKNNADNLIQYESLFEAQDKKKNYTKLDLLFYYKEIPVYLLVN